MPYKIRGTSKGVRMRHNRTVVRINRFGVLLSVKGESVRITYDEDGRVASVNTWGTVTYDTKSGQITNVHSSNETTILVW